MFLLSLEIQLWYDKYSSRHIKQNMYPHKKIDEWNLLQVGVR